MTDSGKNELSRRERQIMDIVYRMGRATAADIQEAMPDAPSYSAVRTFLRLLEEKGHLKHTKQGVRYVYSPKRPRTKAGRQALRRVLDTFFDSSTEKAVAALLDISSENLTDDDLERLAALINDARAEEDAS